MTHRACCRRAFPALMRLDALRHYRARLYNSEQGVSRLNDRAKTLCLSESCSNGICVKSCRV